MYSENWVFNDNLQKLIGAFLVNSVETAEDVLGDGELIAAPSIEAFLEQAAASLARLPWVDRLPCRLCLHDRYATAHGQ